MPSCLEDVCVCVCYICTECLDAVKDIEQEPFREVTPGHTLRKSLQGLEAFHSSAQHQPHDLRARRDARILLGAKAKRMGFCVASSIREEV